MSQFLTNSHVLFLGEKNHMGVQRVNAVYMGQCNLIYTYYYVRSICTLQCTFIYFFLFLFHLNKMYVASTNHVIFFIVTGCAVNYLL